MKVVVMTMKLSLEGMTFSHKVQMTSLSHCHKKKVLKRGELLLNLNLHYVAPLSNLFIPCFPSKSDEIEEIPKNRGYGMNLHVIILKTLL